MELSSLDVAFFQRFLINLLALAALLRCFSRKPYFSASVFPCFMFGIGLFLAAYTLKSIDITLGFAFGLFAIFSMLRYRTEVISTAEMTWLFLVFVIALICAVSPLSNLELLLVTAIVVGAAWIIESPLLRRKLEAQSVRYEKIDNIRPDNRERLLADLRERTGLDVREVRIDSIDFMQDCAQLTIVYASTPAPRASKAHENARVKPGVE